MSALRRLPLFSSWSCFFLLQAAVGWAGDGVFGLPQANDPNRPGTLVLHGGGPLSNDVFNYFVARAGGKKARIVFVPSAGFRPTDYSSDASFRAAVSRRYWSWASLQLEGHVASFEFLYTDSPSDANRESFVQPLKEATGVWFSGGAQSRLNYRYVDFPQPTLFQQELRKVLERGGVVGGTSAGTAIMPEVMTIREARAGDNPAEAVLAHGFGLCDRVIVEQHFDGRNGRFERFLNTLRNSQKLDRLARVPGIGRQMLGVAAEERAAVLLQGNRIGVIGEGKGHLFIKSLDGRALTWHELQPGEQGLVRRLESGQLEMQRDLAANR